MHSSWLAAIEPVNRINVDGVWPGAVADPGHGDPIASRQAAQILEQLPVDGDIEIGDQFGLALRAMRSALTETAMPTSVPAGQ